MLSFKYSNHWEDPEDHQEVTDLVIEKLSISDHELEDLLQSGQSRIKNQIHWARMVLVKIGFIDSSQRGVWSLTEKGLNTDLSKDDLVVLYQTRRQWMGISDHKQEICEPTESKSDDDTENIKLEEPVDYKEELLNIIKALPPSGFERICLPKASSGIWFRSSQRNREKR
ncbi:MAG: winged helix-turn-helix domain-containing protein [Desulfobacterales bacterium]|nr:winged helix-turn-helix domain-containing protein [Desulfobacterales bacterium]